MTPTEQLYTTCEGYNLTQKHIHRLSPSCQSAIATVQKIRRRLRERRMDDKSMDYVAFSDFLIEAGLPVSKAQSLVDALSRYLDGVEQFDFWTLERIELQMLGNGIIAQMESANTGVQY